MCILPWIRESQCCFLWNHPKSVMHVQSIHWFVRLTTSTPCVIPNTPSHWLTCSGKRSLARVKTSKSLMMDPNVNSIVFYYRTTTSSCLSWTTCSHVCSRTSSCFGACYRSSFSWEPRNVISLVSVANFLFQTCCLKCPVTNQIWISDRYDGWN